MNIVQFARGLKAKYDAYTAEQKAKYIYFATDTNEIIMNGQTYGLNLLDPDLNILATVEQTAPGTLVFTKTNGGSTTITIPNATTSLSGLMSATDKTNLDALQTNLGGVTVSITLPTDEGSDTKVMSEKLIVATYATKEELAEAIAAIVVYHGQNAIEVVDGTTEGTKNINLKINANDNVLSQTADGLRTTIGLSVNPDTDTLTITGVGGATIASVDLPDHKNIYHTGVITVTAASQPQDQQFEHEGAQENWPAPANVLPDGKYIGLIFIIANGTKEAVYLNVQELVDVYTAGNGIDVSTANVVSVKIDAASEAFLTVGADGVKLSGIQDAINAVLEHTVNGKALSTDPVLNGADIKLDGYTKATTEAAVAATDTVNQAIGKIETVIENNERTTAEALNDLNERIIAMDPSALEARVEVLENALTWIEA